MRFATHRIGSRYRVSKSVTFTPDPHQKVAGRTVRKVGRTDTRKPAVEMTQHVFFVLGKNGSKPIENIDRACVQGSSEPKTECYTLCQKCNIYTGPASKSSRQNGKKSRQDRYPKTGSRNDTTRFFCVGKKWVETD